jgi:hypothetical protein
MGESVESGVAEDRILEQPQPLVYPAVAGEQEAGVAMAFDDELVEVAALLSGEAME